jgi:hypothetical protein
MLMHQVCPNICRRINDNRHIYYTTAIVHTGSICARNIQATGN